MRPRTDIAGKHAIITGGSRGIGLATAEALGRRGSRVSLLARNEDTLEQAAEGLRGAGVTVATAAVDVADQSAVEDAVAAVTAELGPCDVLVTCAGASRPGRFLELDDEVFRRLMDVNYFGTLHAIRAVAPSMAERGTGSVVGVSSTAGLLGVYGYTAYGASKFAVRGMLESLRQELRPHGVQVACAYPADVDTDMLREEAVYKPAETAALAGTIDPIPPERVAAAIVRGIETGAGHITSDLGTSMLEKAYVLARRPIEAVMDRKIRQARH